MKKIIYCLFLLLISEFNIMFAWDSTAAKYMPLQVGNTWIYRGTYTAYMQSGRSYQIYKITGITDTLGHKYYRIESRIYMISGTLSSGVMQFSDFVRIDSVTMKFTKLWFYCNNFETSIDSLSSQISDSLKICPQEFYTASSYCYDTSAITIFGNTFPSKKYQEFFGPSYGTVYVKGIGIAYSGFGYQMNQSHDTLRGCIINGIVYGDTSILVGINQLSTEVPGNFELAQNYPNPFNPVTKIKFAISGTTVTQTFLSVFDALGREVSVLVNQQLQPGTYEADWDASAYPSGIYFYKLESGSFTETKKMVLIK
ncbi:MAG: 5'-nucleotidase [Chlorobi bacterium OLB5]|nr:MAG: 5'-nucleotidase [Chlorobi bacterium OLB5]